MITSTFNFGFQFLRRHRALTAASMFGLGLILARACLAGRGAYLFFVWNLFLAWLPLLFASLALQFSGRGQVVRGVALGSLWLLFFPNAPYLVTDLIHWHPKPPLQRSAVWYDLLLCVHFAWLGLALGFASLRSLERAVSDRYGAWSGTLFATASLGLASYGVCLGRFGRWNSWDLFTQPLQLLSVLARDILHPRSHLHTWQFTALCGMVLICAYWAGLTPIEEKAAEERAKTF